MAMQVVDTAAAQGSTLHAGLSEYVMVYDEDTNVILQATLPGISGAALLKELRQGSIEGNLKCMVPGPVGSLLITEDTRKLAAGTYRFYKVQGTSAGTGAASTSERMSIKFVYQKEKQTHVSHFVKRPTLAQIHKQVEKLFPRFKREAYTLRADDTITDEDEWLALDVAPSKKKVFTIAVVSNSKAFNKFKVVDGLELLGVEGAALNATSQFQSDELDMDAMLPDIVQQCTRWKTVADLMAHVGDDLAARFLTSHPQQYSKEAGCRELISPILVAAALIAGEVEVHAEFSVAGVHAHGSVDWVMIFKQYSVIVIEAKLNTPFDEYMGQLAAEMMAAREVYAMDFLKKTKHEAAEAVQQVPSYGILTNGLNFQFYKFTSGATCAARSLLRSTAIPLLLTQGSTAKDACEQARPIVQLVLHILREQKAAIAPLAEEAAKMQRL